MKYTLVNADGQWIAGFTDRCDCMGVGQSPNEAIESLEAMHILNIVACVGSEDGQQAH